MDMYVWTERDGVSEWIQDTPVSTDYFEVTFRNG